MQLLRGAVPWVAALTPWLLATLSNEESWVAKGCLGFLLLMFFAWWCPPTFHTMFRRRPPGVVAIAYSLMTVGSCLYGWLAIHNSRAMANDLEPVLGQTLLPDAVTATLPIVVMATTIVLTFVLGNLMRSYANLHSIEHEENSPALPRYVRQLGSIARWIDWLIRVAMFASIVAVSQLFVALEVDEPVSLIGQWAPSFKDVFRLLWVTMTCYYVLLILWDCVILANLRFAVDPETRLAVSKVMRYEAVPVHLAGLMAAGLMCFALQGALIMDKLVWTAMILALAGIVLLIMSTVRSSWLSNILTPAQSAL